MAILVWTADAQTTPAPKKSPTTSSAKKTAAHKGGTPAAKKAATSTHKGTTAARKTGPSHSSTTAARKSGSTSKGATAARKGSTRKGPAKRTATTWRNRQMAPSPERYKEIQQALAAKGYLNLEEANGAWNQSSVDALKRFQSAQNLESTGKINSLSLIALGLGPKHDSAPAKPAEIPQLR